jgi:3-oxoadipate enol-lactonase
VTVVFCGSLGSTREMWAPQVETMQGAIVVEHPGHGGAAPPLGPVDVDVLARRVLHGVDGACSLVGLSLGGAVAMRAAALAPERVSGLVLASMSQRFGSPSRWRERADVVRSEGLAAIVDGVLGRWFTPAHSDVDRWRSMFLSIDSEAYARCCEALAVWDGSGDLARIVAPTLVIAGAEDPTSPPEHARALASRITGARVAVIDGAAHLANVEKASEFNRLLEEHL